MTAADESAEPTGDETSRKLIDAARVKFGMQLADPEFRVTGTQLVKIVELEHAMNQPGWAATSSAGPLA